MEDYRDPADKKRGRGRKAPPQPEHGEPSLFDPLEPDCDCNPEGHQSTCWKVRATFAPTPLHTAHRHPDRETSVEAAEKAVERSQRLKAQVYEAFKKHGAMTDAELAQLPQFQGVPYTSVSKRRTDLVQAGLLEDSGETRGHPERPNSKMMVWRCPK